MNLSSTYCPVNLGLSVVGEQMDICPDTDNLCGSPVKPQASASRKVLQDMRKKSAVSSSGKQCSLVNLVTWAPS